MGMTLRGRGAGRATPGIDMGAHFVVSGAAHGTNRPPRQVDRGEKGFL